MERFVEMAAGIVGDGWVCQIHYHGPGGAQVFSLLLWLGHGGHSFGELLFVHDAIACVHLPAQIIIPAVP